MITIAEKDGATIIVIEQPNFKEKEIINEAKKLYVSAQIADFKGMGIPKTQNSTDRDLA